VGVAVNMPQTDPDSSYLIRIHGTCMVIAWIGTVSLGIVFARYYKQTWVSSTLCGVKVWFACHRALMVTSVTLMLIAQICIFIYVGGYHVGLHQLFGTLAFTLALLNPIGALLRPEPDAPNRWLFNWGHWFLGNVAHISAITAIFLATKLSAADLPKQFMWVIITFVIFKIIVHLILQFHTFYVKRNRSFNPVATNDIAMNDMSDSHDDHREADGPGSGFRKAVLVVYIVALIAFVVALVSLINLPKTTLE